MFIEHLPAEYVHLCRAVEQLIEKKNPLKVPRRLVNTTHRFLGPMDGTITEWIRSGLNCVK